MGLTTANYLSLSTHSTAYLPVFLLNFLSIFLFTFLLPYLHIFPVYLPAYLCQSPTVSASYPAAPQTLCDKTKPQSCLAMREEVRWVVEGGGLGGGNILYGHD